MSAQRVDGICTSLTISGAMLLYARGNFDLSEYGLADWFLLVVWLLAVSVFSAFVADARARLRGEK